MKSRNYSGETIYVASMFLFGLLIIFMSIELGFRKTGELGPGFFPFLIGGLISLTSVLLLLKAFFGKEAIPPQPSWQRKQGKRLWGGVVTFGGWVILTPYLGYAVVTFLFAFVYSKLLGLEGWVRPLVLSIGIILFVYLLFGVWFYVDLPKGIFG